MIHKVLIPVAGRGTRLMPVTSVVPKALFPLVTNDNTIRCFLHMILEQIVTAGIEQVGIVVSQNQTDLLKQYFKSAVSGGFGRLPVHIEYIVQSTPAGFGDAVLQAADFVGNEPFVLMLGDHIHIAGDNEPSCVMQVTGAFEDSDGAAMIGVQQVSVDELCMVGVVRGERIKDNIYLCTDFIEKPDMQIAQKRLVTENLPEGAFLAHCGIYAFNPEIFDCLLQVSKTARKAGREIELSDAQSLLLKRHPGRYFLYRIAGHAYDIGTPAGYVNAQTACIHSNAGLLRYVSRPYHQAIV